MVKDGIYGNFVAKKNKNLQMGNVWNITDYFKSTTDWWGDFSECNFGKIGPQPIIGSRG